jgi:hypothetical protein
MNRQQRDDPWDRLVAEGQAHWEALIAHNAAKIDGVPQFAEFALAEHFVCRRRRCSPSSARSPRPIADRSKPSTAFAG